MERVTAKPFLKWAGGKSQLLKAFERYYPAGLFNGKIKKYVEPLLGSGAVFFWIMKNVNIEKAYLFEINPELTNCYQVIKNNVIDLIKLLRKYETEYLSLDDKPRKDFYYSKRDKFNRVIKSRVQTMDIEKASLMIFLNHTCFNGLYRVNAEGLFNVPMGTYKKPKICDEKNLLDVNKVLQKAEIFCEDFENSSKYIDEKTFVYFDPPYRPLSSTSHFRSYSKHDFNDEEQKRLADFYRKLDEKKAMVMLSNSDPKNEDPNSDFFDNLYKEFHIHRIRANRMINSIASKRGEINELVITNY